MKKLWIFVMIAMPSLHGKELDSFSEISNALMGGNNIRMVVQTDNCSSPGKSDYSFFIEASGVMIRPTYVQFANTHLTTNYPGFEKLPLLENVTYKISDEGEVHIMIRVFTLPDYQMKSEYSMICILGHSAKIYTNE